jgi:hypothetical protein
MDLASDAVALIPMIKSAVSDCESDIKYSISEACISDIGTAIKDLTNISIDIAEFKWD